MIKLNWEPFKNISTLKSLGVHGTEDDENYYLYLVDGPLIFECILAKANTNAHLEDFETNYKPIWNKKISVAIESFPPFASRLLGEQQMFKQIRGISQACTQGQNTIVWENPYPQAKLMATEVVGAEIGDTCDVFVLDRDGENELLPPLFGVANAVLKQFGYSVNVPEKFYRHRSEFPTDIYQGMQIKYVYNSLTAKTIRINLILNEVTD